MNTVQISSLLSSGWFFSALALAMRLAYSTGGRMGRTFSQSSGKRSRMSRTMAGQAELITGRGMLGLRI